jgi:hypothetical protein
MPACIRGVINLRGAVVPVMDLSNRFGKPSTPVTKSTCIVITEVDGWPRANARTWAWWWTRCRRCWRFPPSRSSRRPPLAPRSAADFIQGIAKVNGKFVIVLNVSQGAVGRRDQRHGPRGPNADMEWLQPDRGQPAGLALALQTEIAAMKPITDAEFAQLPAFHLRPPASRCGDPSRPWSPGRLGKRLDHHGLASFGDYFKLLASGERNRRSAGGGGLADHQRDLLFPRDQTLRLPARTGPSRTQPGQSYRVWSAASSSGEEAYSMAMVLADCLPGGNLEVLGTDISTQVLQGARARCTPWSAGAICRPTTCKRFASRARVTTTAAADGAAVAQPRQVWPGQPERAAAGHRASLTWSFCAT